MATLDITPLRRVAIAYMERGEKGLTLAENELLEEVCNMMADFDSRFVQYPLLAAAFVARCVMYGRIDTQELQALLDMLIAADALKGKKYLC